MGVSVFLNGRWLTGSASVLMVTSALYAQTAVTVAPPTTEAIAPYASVFKDYKPYTDEPIVNWKAANDTTASIGGWREYARQAQQAGNTPAHAGHGAPAVLEPERKAAP